MKCTGRRRVNWKKKRKRSRKNDGKNGVRYSLGEWNPLFCFSYYYLQLQCIFFSFRMKCLSFWMCERDREEHRMGDDDGKDGKSLKTDRKKIYSHSISRIFSACTPHTYTAQTLNCKTKTSRRTTEQERRRRRSEIERGKWCRKVYETTNSWKNNTGNNAIELEFIFLLSFNSLFRTS